MKFWVYCAKISGRPKKDHSAPEKLLENEQLCLTQAQQRGPVCRRDVVERVIEQPFLLQTPGIKACSPEPAYGCWSPTPSIPVDGGWVAA
jgi:hypothetical protein